MIGSHRQAVGEALWRRALISLSINQKRGEKESEKNHDEMDRIKRQPDV